MGHLCRYRLSIRKKEKTVLICPTQLAFMEGKTLNDRFDFIQVLLRPMEKMTYVNAMTLLKIGYSGTKDWFDPIKYLKNGMLYQYTYSGSRRIHSDGVLTYDELHPLQVAWLLEQGYDIFNWIEKGWAIDRTKVLEPA